MSADEDDIFPEYCPENDSSVFTNKGLARSISQYVELPGKAAHDALLEASQKLIPLADYVENHFVREPQNTKPKAHSEQK